MFPIMHTEYGEKEKNQGGFLHTCGSDQSLVVATLGLLGQKG